MSIAALETLARAAGRPLPSRSDARTRLLEALERVKDNLPSSLEFSPAMLGAAIGERLADGVSLESCADWHWDGLCIVAAAVRNDPAALRIVESSVRRVAANALVARGFSATEIAAVVDEMLGAGPSAERQRGLGRKLRHYAGRDSFTSFVRTELVRAALQRRRRSHPRPRP